MANAMTTAKRSNARTEPTGAVLNRINENTEYLFEKFRVDFLSAKSSIPASTLRSHKTRLKLSQEAATKLCAIAEVKAAGFTRKQLRPDIQIWFDEK